MGEQASLLARLGATARDRRVPDDPATLVRLVRYLEAVLEANERVNLTAARDLDRAVDVLALSALAVTRSVDSPPGLVVDLGTGNGLPGVAAALAWPAARVLLVERRGRKAQAVAACVEAVGLSNAEVVVCDGRELLRERPEVRGATDLVTVRAVGRLDEAVGMAAAWLAPGGRLAHWKGRALSVEEVRAGEAAARRAGLCVLPTLTFDDEAGPARLVLAERPPDGA
jgi:16S rRNA (guanine527-N7)-methyltransferase